MPERAFLFRFSDQKSGSGLASGEARLFTSSNVRMGIHIGGTSDLDDRLTRHHTGYVPATKIRLPVTLITILPLPKYKAFAFEKYLKSGSGRAFMNKRFI